MTCVYLLACIFMLFPVSIKAGLLLQESDSIIKIVNWTVLNETQRRFERQYADPCASAPCKNGGLCKSSGNEFNCACVEPFSGPTCEQSPCTSYPCKNDGLCIINEKSYVCQCKPPYFGQRCDLSPCSKNPCKNNGTCEIYNDTHLCTCEPPYTGINCETNQTDTCNPNPCKNGGSCYKIGNSTSCKCRKGYSGAKCDIVCDCENGFCEKDLSGQVQCYCLPEYGRSSLTKKCSACYCGKGAGCTIHEGTITCLCPPFYIQRYGHCIELCGAKECKDGKCSREKSIPYCKCKENYTGEFCEDRKLPDFTKWIIVGVSVGIVLALLSGVASFYLYRHYYKKWADTPIKLHVIIE